MRTEFLKELSIAEEKAEAERKAKEEMDMHSPSRVMAEIGDDIAQGYDIVEK